MPVRVVSADESAQRDQAAINSGTPSRTLMQRAGAGAADAIVARFRSRLNDGALVFAGPGNNGGDGWVVAGHLARSGLPVKIVEAGSAKTPDAIAERDAALEVLAAPTGMENTAAENPGVVIDALLGTGFQGQPHGVVQEAISRSTVME